MGRLYSRSFLIPFGIVTALFIMNISLVTWAEVNSSLSINPIFGYGSMLTLYVACVLEALGFSIFVRFVKIFWKKWRKLVHDS
jgi:hypothetical protein